MTHRDPTLLTKLSDLERSILALLAQGHTAKSIAAQTGRSVGSINEKLREARRKTGATSSRDLARWLSQENSDELFGMASAETTPPETPRAARAWRLTPGGIAVLFALLAAVALLPLQHEAPRVLPHDSLTDSFMEPIATHTPLRDERAKLLTESRDAAWAPQAEAMLRSRYSPTLSAAGHTAFLRVTCERTICEIAAVLPPVGRKRINTTMQAFQKAALSDNGIIKQSGVAFYLSTIAPAKMSVLAYWSRLPPTTTKAFL